MEKNISYTFHSWRQSSLSTTSYGGEYPANSKVFSRFLYIPTLSPILSSSLSNHVLGVIDVHGMGQFVDADGDFSWGKEVVRRAYIPSHEVMFSQLGFHIWVAVRIISKKKNVQKNNSSVYDPVLSQVPLFPICLFGGTLCARHASQKPDFCSPQNSIGWPMKGWG